MSTYSSNTKPLLFEESMGHHFQPRRLSRANRAHRTAVPAQLVVPTPLQRARATYRKVAQRRLSGHRPG
jgi:hypothetical protein